MIAVLVAFAAGAWTVKFTNPQGWSNVNVYTWNSVTNENFSGGWPGSAMTKEGNLWTYTGSGSPNRIIFNNGSGGQTNDLVFTDGATYNMNGAMDVVIEYAKIYVPVSEYNHSICYIYSWDPVLFGNPGTQMSKTTVGNTEYWVVEVNQELLPATVNGWLLHNGNWGNKTSDLPKVEFKANYVYNINGTSYELGSEPVDPTPSDDLVYLAGDFNGYNAADENYKFSKNDDGLYTLSIPSLTGNFKVVSNGEWLGTTTPVESGVEYTLSDIGYGNMHLSSDEGTDVTLTFNSSNKTLIIDYTAVSAPSPDELYVIGTLPGGQWDPSYGISLTKEGDSFSGDVEIEAAPANEYGYFSLCTLLGADSNDWNVGNRYGADSNEPLVALPAETYAFVKADDPKPWMVTPGKYSITVDFIENTMKLTSISTGVEGIEADNDVPAVYFNLQGVKVNNPANGLYIMKQGEKVSKVMVR